MKKLLILSTLLLTGCADVYVEKEYEAEFFEKIEFCKNNNMQIELHETHLPGLDIIVDVECTFRDE